MWIYYEKGKGFKLYPIHVREYKSKEELLKLLSCNSFDILSWRTEDVYYPVMNLILRVLAMLKVVKLQPGFLFEAISRCSHPSVSHSFTIYHSEKVLL